MTSLEQIIERWTEKVRGLVHTAVNGAIENPHSEESRMGWEKYSRSDAAEAAAGDPEWAFVVGFEAGRAYEADALTAKWGDEK